MRPCGAIHKMSYVLSLWLLGFFSQQARAAAYEKSVVKLQTSRQYPDFDAPWRRKPVKMEHHLAVVVKGGHLLVSARAVGFARSLAMTRFGESRRFPLKLTFVDYVAGLALLTPEEPLALAGLEPLALGSDPALQREVSLLIGPETEQLVALPALVKDVAIMRSGTASHYGLSHLCLEVGQRSGLGWSEPLVAGGRLVGLTVGQDKTHVYALPAKIIKHFLSDFAHPPYRGFIRLGVAIAPLESPALRSFLQVTPDQGGVVITQISEGSAFYGRLKPRDVLIKIGDTPITASGHYDEPVWGRTHFIDRLSQYYGGDEVKLTVIRSGQKTLVAAKVPRYEPQKDVIPGTLFEDEAYLIFGGLILQELDEGFLSSWGRTWRERAPYQFLYALAYRNGLTQTDEHIVVLNRLLSDHINKGYEGRDNHVLTTVNGQAVHNLADVAQALRQPVLRHGHKLAVLEFLRHGGPIVLAYDGLQAAHKRLMKKYNIPATGHFFDPAPEALSAQGTTNTTTNTKTDANADSD